MNCLDGRKLYCRTIEEKILQCWIDRQAKKLSCRDIVYVQSISGNLIYRLWNTDIVRKIDNDIYINISGNVEERDRYYHFNGFWQPREYIISNTTKSRLNAFLDYYGFNSLEVHSSQKDWSVKYQGEELEVDKWYKLDLQNKN